MTRAFNAHLHSGDVFIDPLALALRSFEERVVGGRVYSTDELRASDNGPCNRKVTRPLFGSTRIADRISGFRGRVGQIDGLARPTQSPRFNITGTRVSSIAGPCLAPNGKRGLAAAFDR